MHLQTDPYLPSSFLRTQATIETSERLTEPLLAYFSTIPLTNLSPQSSSKILGQYPGRRRSHNIASDIGLSLDAPGVGIAGRAIVLLRPGTEVKV